MVHTCVPDNFVKELAKMNYEAVNRIKKSFSKRTAMLKQGFFFYANMNKARLSRSPLTVSSTTQQLKLIINSAV